MYLTQALHRNCQQQPGKHALIGATGRVSYAQWAARSARLAAVLRAHGVKRGDRVAILGKNRVEYALCYTAIWWLGAIACPINTRWSVTEIAASVRDCESRVIMIDDDLADLVAAIQAEAPAVTTIVRSATADAEPIEDVRASGADVAVLLYTGGTTGQPKGVILSHDNLVSSALAKLAAVPSLEESVALIATPMFHVASIGRLLPHMIAGGTCAVLEQFRVPLLLEVVERQGVTDLALVPTMLRTLLDDPSFAPERLRSVRRIGYGAAPIDEALLERVLDRLPWADLSQSYGMTECSALATFSLPSDHLPAARASGRSRSAGRAVSIAEIRIVDSDGGALPTGEIGEIAVRGPHVMTGYWRRPEETASALRNGWLHTGDVGRLDSEGYLYIVDRAKDMIITGGENVYSTEVENALATHPGVQACAVFAIPSKEWGEAVHAVVVPREPLDEQALIAHVRKTLAGYKCPRSIQMVSELPLTPAGKVAKNILREPHWRGASRKVS